MEFLRYLFHFTKMKYKVYLTIFVNFDWNLSVIIPQKYFNTKMQKVLHKPYFFILMQIIPWKFQHFNLILEFTDQDFCAVFMSWQMSWDVMSLAEFPSALWHHFPEFIIRSPYIHLWVMLTQCLLNSVYLFFLGSEHLWYTVT